MTKPHPFDRGDYVLAALRGDPNDWRTHAARGILELEGDAARHLAGFEGDGVAFYRAVLHWLDGDEDRARQLLSQSRDPAAQALQGLIERPKIKVLSQTIAQSPSPFALYHGMIADPKFEITNVDFTVGSGDPLPSADAMDHVDPADPPAFHIASIVEWVPLLDNLPALGCPVFGHVLDPDLVSQTNLSLYPVFDELIVNGAREKQLLEAHTRRRASVYPHCLALREADLQPIGFPEGGPTIDLLMTGTAIDVFHPDKRAFLSAILEIDECLPLIVHGYLPKQYYFRTYSRSRAVASYMRHNAHHVGQGPESRILEGLAAGRPVLSLTGTVLELYFNEADGFYTFDADFRTLGDAFRRLARGAERRDALTRTALRTRHLFDYRNIGSRYLRFLTVRAALCERTQPASRHEQIHQRASVTLGFPKLHPSLVERSLHRAGKLSRGGKDVSSSLIIARELVSDATERIILLRPEPMRSDSQQDAIANDLARAFEILSQVIALHPWNLAARFMSVRAGLHLGSDEQRAAALALLDETLAQPSDAWSLPPADHVLPLDFFPHMFDYRSYLEDVFAEPMDGSRPGRRIAMVLASLNAYRGWYGGEPRHFAAARSLHPDFMNYRLWAARAALLAPSGLSSDARSEIRKDLEDAARDPMTAQRATHLLCRFSEELYEVARPPDEILRLAHKLESCLLYVANPAGDAGSAQERAWRLPGSTFNVDATEQVKAQGLVPQISVIIAPRPRRDYGPLLRSLGSQSIGRVAVQVIWSDPFGLPPPSMPGAVDVWVRGGQDSVMEHLNRCYNSALLQATGPVVMVCDQTTSLPPQFLSVVAATYAEGAKPLVLATVPGATKPEIVENLIGCLESTVAFRRSDLIDVGGFDEASVFAGRSSGAFDVAARIAASPSYMATVATTGPLGEQRHVHALARDYLRSRFGDGRRLPIVENRAIMALRLANQSG